MMVGPTGRLLPKTGFIPANHKNADEALRSGGVVIVFPGGDYDVYRPTLSREQDRLRRPHRVRAGRHQRRRPDRADGVDRRPGGQLFLSRGRLDGQGAAARQAVARQDPADLVRLPVRAVSAVLPVNVPLPTKIVTQVLPPIDIVAEFGEDPDVDEVDAHVRHVMQRALDELAKERRLPVLG